MGGTDGLPRPASSSSQQEQSESSKVRRTMGLETWTAEKEPGAKEEEQPGAKEKALERKRQLEAIRPQMLKVGEVLAALALERISSQRGRCSTRRRGPSLIRRLWLRGAESC